MNRVSSNSADVSRETLERELGRDFRALDEAATARLDDLVEQYLHHRVKLLTGAHTRGEADILRLLHLHSRVALLEAVIDRPKSFNLKEMKELFRSTLIVEQNDAVERGKDSPARAIAQLEISDAEKAKLFAGLTEVAMERLRAGGVQGLPSGS